MRGKGWTLHQWNEKKRGGSKHDSAPGVGHGWPWSWLKMYDMWLLVWAFFGHITCVRSKHSAVEITTAIAWPIATVRSRVSSTWFLQVGWCLTRVTFGLAAGLESIGGTSTDVVAMFDVQPVRMNGCHSAYQPDWPLQIMNSIIDSYLALLSSQLLTILLIQII